MDKELKERLENIEEKISHMLSLFLVGLFYYFGFSSGLYGSGSFNISSPVFSISATFLPD